MLFEKCFTTKQNKCLKLTHKKGTNISDRFYEAIELNMLAVDEGVISAINSEITIGSTVKQAS